LPLVISGDGSSIAIAHSLTLGSHEFGENVIQDLVQRFPQLLPVAEIDPQFVNPVPICRELVTPAGPAFFWAQA
jgi:uncharacterized pyridoxal phosphate-containing UPF0001 family protein